MTLTVAIKGLCSLSSVFQSCGIKQAKIQIYSAWIVTHVLFDLLRQLLEGRPLVRLPCPAVLDQVTEFALCESLQGVCASRCHLPDDTVAVDATERALHGYHFINDCSVVERGKNTCQCDQ